MVLFYHNAVLCSTLISTFHTFIPKKCVPWLLLTVLSLNGTLVEEIVFLKFYFKENFVLQNFSNIGKQAYIYFFSFYKILKLCSVLCA